MYSETSDSGPSERGTPYREETSLQRDTGQGPKNYFPYSSDTF